MPTLRLQDVDVDFPFEPYQCQRDYMRTVINTLQKEQNAILESPTGTGKTMSLLCSSLAWLEKYKTLEKVNNAVSASESAQNLVKWLGTGSTAAAAGDGRMPPLNPGIGSPRIIYASRTHAQLTQVIKELKRTAYSGVKTSVVGSRDQLCIHPFVSEKKDSMEKLRACRAKVATKSCSFKNNVEVKKTDPQFTGSCSTESSILDIEDLVRLGQKHKVCPYYMARAMAKETADMVFMPYNYLLDAGARRANGVELSGAVVIFDEAHNLEQVCEDSASMTISSREVSMAILDAQEILDQRIKLIEEEQDDGGGAQENSAMGASVKLSDVVNAKTFVVNLEAALDKLVIKGTERVEEGAYLFTIMESCGATVEAFKDLADKMDDMGAYLSENHTGGFRANGQGLMKVAVVLKLLYSLRMSQPRPTAETHVNTSHLRSCYKLYIELVTKKPSGSSHWTVAPSSDKPEKVLNYWCFSPGYTMQTLMSLGVRSVLVTSGTLKPMDSYCSEMTIPFHQRLESSHVIGKDQVMVAVLPNGPDGTELKSNYQNRDRLSYISSLGETVLRLIEQIPDGFLIFFPSYSIMGNTVKVWREEGIMSRIEEYKEFFVEPKGKEEFNKAMAAYYKRIEDGTRRGAVFAGVCRGKVSEGLDFSDRNGRAVVITGIPFPPFFDPKVKLKQKYLDERLFKWKPDRFGDKDKPLGGAKWYRQQATRAVNQAIGRVIRHKDDYGAIFLCDSRFGSSTQRSELPNWMKENVREFPKLQDALTATDSFFRRLWQKHGASATGKMDGGSSGSMCGSSGTKLGSSALSTGPGNANRKRPLLPRDKAGSPPPDSVNITDSYKTVPVPGFVRPNFKGFVKRSRGNASSAQGSALDKIDWADGRRAVVTAEQTRSQEVQAKAEMEVKKPSGLDFLMPRTRKTTIRVVQAAPSQASLELMTQIKSTLTDTETRQLAEGMSLYLAGGGVQDFLGVLLRLFKSKSRGKEYLSAFRPYIKVNHAQEFDKQVSSFCTDDADSHEEVHSDNEAPERNSENEKSTTPNKKPVKAKASQSSKLASQWVSPDPGFFQSDSSGPPAKGTDSASLNKTTNKNSDGSTAVSQECSICHKPAAHPAGTSGCGHVGCFTCWVSYLKTTSSCPTCRSKVRKRDIAASIKRSS